jgi:hypothetical protein
LGPLARESPCISDCAGAVHLLQFKVIEHWL